MSSPPIIALLLPDYFYFVFAVCACVSACVVIFYAKRHPNPHFRPRKSDIGIVSFVLLFMSGGVAFFTSGALDADFDKEKLEKRAKDAQRVAKATGTSAEEEMGSKRGSRDATEKGSTSSNTPGLPDDVPEEIRELVGGGKK